MDKFILQKLLKDRALSLKDIAKKFKMSEEEAQQELKSYLDSGFIVLTLDGYMLSEEIGVILCKVVLRKSNYAYVTPIQYLGEGNKKHDIRISGRSLQGFILNDLVYVKLEYEGEGTILSLYKRKEYLVGPIFKRTSNGYNVKAKEVENTDIEVILKEDLTNAKVSDGDLVKAKIINSEIDKIYVSFDEVLVRKDEVSSDISSIIVSNDAPLTFPSSVLVEAKMLPQSVSEKDLSGRQDFRDDLIVTIDGEDALDFDDAVEAKRITNGYQVIVHIADVAHYVRPNSAIDEEALRRGTSIYVADRVVPMLPTELSNGICSLNPNVDRLTISVVMNLDESGNVYMSKVVPGVIRSKARLTYKQVNEYLESGKSDILSDEIKEMLDILNTVTKQIRRRRDRNGSLNLISTELKFVLDENKEPIEVIKREQGQGEKLIEDLMIVANVEVARLFEKLRIPVLFRTHDNPPSDKIDSFRKFLRNINMSQDFPSKISSKSLSHWFDSIEDQKQKAVISSFLLRSLAKAKYEPSNTGHFGLAEEDYLHFTSPIRRYPDLIVSRYLHTYVFEEQEVKRSKLFDKLVSLGYVTSAAERRAVSIERKVEDLESCKYMNKHMDEEFNAVVTSITNYGMYLELENGVEGLIAISDIDPTKKFVYSEKHMDVQCTSKDRENNIYYKLGSTLKVFVKRVDFDTLTIEVYTKEAKEYASYYEEYKSQEENDKREIRESRDSSRFSRDRKSGSRDRRDSRDRRSSSRSGDRFDRRRSSDHRRDDRKRDYSRDDRKKDYRRDDRMRNDFSKPRGKKKIYYNAQGEKRGNYSKRGRSNDRRK